MQDYKNIILTENGDLSSINVWGGEDNDPPIYGKVFVAVKPTSGSLLSNQKKEAIRTSLKTRNTLSIDVEMVDATYLYVNPTITVRYNPELTSLSAAALNDKIQTALISFEADKLGTFGNKFYLYELSEKLKDADSSFISVDVDILLEKRFIPLTTEISTYQINYYQKVFEPHAGHLGSLTSTSFTVDDTSALFLDHDGYGILRTYTVDSGSKNYRDNNFGTIDYDTGLITLTNKLISAYDGDYLSLKIKPDGKNIFGQRNQIILISGATIETINDSTDASTSSVGLVATSGVSTTIASDNSTASSGSTTSYSI